MLCGARGIGAPECRSVEKAVVSNVPVEQEGTGGNALPPVGLTLLGLIKPAVIHVHVWRGS